MPYSKPFGVGQAIKCSGVLDSDSNVTALPAEPSETPQCVPANQEQAAAGSALQPSVVAVQGVQSTRQQLIMSTGHGDLTLLKSEDPLGKLRWNHAQFSDPASRQSRATNPLNTAHVCRKCRSMLSFAALEPVVQCT